MVGTSIGGQRAAQTNRVRHGKDFYARIGAIGGRKGTTGGFAANRELARLAGRKGGMISRRRKATVVADAQKAVKAPLDTKKLSTKADYELAA